MVLEKLRRCAETGLGKNSRIKQTVISIPQHFTEAQKECLLECAKAAKFRDTRLIESTAAVAISYAIEENKKAIIIMYTNQLC